MTRDQFTNGLRILRSTDSHELGDPDWWPHFAQHPYDFLMRCDDERATIIWRAMVNRGAATSGEGDDA